MVLLQFLGFIYLAIGFLYALYILLWGADPWYYFPINMLGGPVMIIYISVATIREKRFKL